MLAPTPGKSVLKVVDFLKPDMVVPQLRANRKSAVLEELSRHLAERHEGIDPETLKQVLEARELQASTAIGDGIAIPHGKLESVPTLVGALGRSPTGLDFDSLDGKPTHLVFLLVAPTGSAGTHLKALARLSRLFREGEFRKRLIDARDARAMYDVISDEDAKH